jgi:hypothetical protein
MNAISSPKPFRLNRFISVVIATLLLTAPLRAQQTAQPARTAPPRQTSTLAEPTFDTLLAADAYKFYGEVRNVGQLLNNGGAGEIVDPIIKLADPGPQFKAMVNFLKKHSEELGSSRLMFASWPARTDVPMVFVAIEFPTNEDAAKFAPKLETFLPTVLPPVPVESPNGSSTTAEAASSATVAKPAPTPSPANIAPAQPPAERLPFVITHSGNLVCISDKSFKFEKLHPASSKPLFQDQNFRITRDQFSSEAIFLFLNVALEEQNKPKPPSPQMKAEAEAAAERARQEEEAKASEMARANANATPEEQPTSDANRPVRLGVLVAPPEPSPTPTPTKEQQAQRVASSQIGQLLDAIGFGEPQWPDAVGFALALDGNEYVLRAMLVDKPDARKVLIPFIPQLSSGPAYATEAASVLPDDTEVFVSASIDLSRTYEGMRKEAEIRAKNAPRVRPLVYRNGVMVPSDNPAEPPLDAFAQFEKKAGFKIKDDLLSALGNEIVLAGSLKTLQSAGGMKLGIPTPSTTVTEPGADKEDQNKKQNEVLPILLIEVKDRDAVRRLMPSVLNGLGIGEANLVAQTERREDTEMINYAGVFAYAFVGNFLVISEAPTVRRVIDANLNHQTLSSNTVFRNSRRWQSRGTLGQVYISPALMEGYQDEVRKQSATMDAELRDFLLSLNPNSEAITYAISNDGLGTQHELHLPKNLILTMIAGISSATRNPPPEQNEMIAAGMLQYLVNVETQYKDGPGKGSYGSIDKLVEAKLFSKDIIDKYGYNFEVNVIGDGFEAVATPREYGKTGKRSFFVDKSGVVRGDDHGGGPATIADKPIQ